MSDIITIKEYNFKQLLKNMYENIIIFKHNNYKNK